MFLALVAVGLLGLLLSLRFKAPALLVATAGIVGVTITTSFVSARSITDVILTALALAVALQGAYVCGILFARWRIASLRSPRNRAHKALDP